MNNKTTRNQRNLFHSGLFLLVVSLLGIAGSWLADSRVNSAASWPATSGKILTSKKINSATKSGRLAVISEIAKIEYRYSVEGQTFKGERRRVIPMLHTKDESPEAIVARYPQGSGVKVYYDPGNPEDALLEPVPGEDAKETLVMIKLAGWACLPISLLLFWMARYAPNGLQDASFSQPKVAKYRPATPGVVRPWHPILRYSLMGFGGFICLFGILLTMSFFKSEHNHSLVVETITGVFMVGVAASGAVLVRYAVTRPTRRTLAA